MPAELTGNDVLMSERQREEFVEAVPDIADTGGLLSLVEMILKHPKSLEALVRRPDAQASLVPRLLAISLTSFTLYGVTMAIVIGASGLNIELREMKDVLDRGGSLILIQPAESASLLHQGNTAAGLVLAYSFGLIAATGVCLPSLYFYGLLSGVRLSMLDVVTHALKGKATTAVALVGILPVYVAVAMGVLIVPTLDSIVPLALWPGFILPFIAGLWGTVSLYRGLAGLADTLPADRCERRGCFLRRLVFSWGACYTAVAPVMIFTVWQSLQSLL
jgi:hypothetical protein